MQIAKVASIFKYDGSEMFSDGVINATRKLQTTDYQ